MSRERPTEAEFEALKQRRNAAVSALVDAFCEKQGWDRRKSTWHVSHSSDCYCACPGGPCQHTWDGPEWSDDTEGFSSSATCSRCGAVQMFHDMRTAEF